MAATLKKQLEAFNSSGDILNWEGKIDESYNFYDWFCKDTALKNKAIKLFKKVNQIAKSKKIDSEKTYVSFKNNCGNAFYDDFRICDVRTGYIIYTITPSYPDGKGNTNADVWGKENNFDEALVKGNWKDVVKFFNSHADYQKVLIGTKEEVLNFLTINNGDINDSIK